jgi:hypothetical protein
MRTKTKKYKESKPRNKYTLKQKRDLAEKIRSYSLEDIDRDFSRLVEIGCESKKTDSKLLVGNRVVDHFTFVERLNTISKKGVSFYDMYQNRGHYAGLKYVKNFMKKSFKGTGEEKRWYNLFRFYFGSVTIFRPLVAMEYYCMFTPKHAVLDPTMGWGGRLVGACALSLPRYIGIDSNIHLKTPYRELQDFLEPRSPTAIELYFEDAVKFDYSRLKYDMVFTSPPYYNIELYHGKREYSTKDEWDSEFYVPLFTKTYDGMMAGGYYCLNINREIFERVCLGLFGKPFKTFPLKKVNKLAKNGYSEYVYVWKK